MKAPETSEQENAALVQSGAILSQAEIQEARIVAEAEAARDKLRKQQEKEQEAQLMGDPQSAQKTHAYMMATSRDYAQRFISRSFPKGHQFCITLVVEDDIATQSLFEAVESNAPLSEEEQKAGKPARVPVLIGGCRVVGIYKHNIGAELMELKKHLMEVASR